jgi:thioredoxin reductase (NADPH)
MYDAIIIGGGPAGLSAAIYCARFNLKTVLISKDIGGYMMEAPQIDNYPGFVSVSGLELANKMREQVEKLGIEIVEEEAAEIKNGFTVKTKSNKKFEGKNIILALGTERRKVNIKGEAEFTGKGVSYCATCDAAFFKNKTVAVAGGANSAVVSAILLSKFAKEVYILYRNKPLRADPYWVEKIDKIKNIKVHCCVNITEIKGTKKVESILLDNGKEMKVDGVFVEIGSVPVVSIATSLGVKLDKEGYIIVDNEQKTNIDGVYAAGDISTGSNKLRQIITACSEGAIAADSIHKNLK